MPTRAALATSEVLELEPHGPDFNSKCLDSFIERAAMDHADTAIPSSQ